MFYLVLLGCIWFYLVLPKFKKVFSSVKDKKIGLKLKKSRQALYFYILLVFGFFFSYITIS